MTCSLSSNIFYVVFLFLKCRQKSLCRSLRCCTSYWSVFVLLIADLNKAEFERFTDKIIIISTHKCMRHLSENKHVYVGFSLRFTRKARQSEAMTFYLYSFFFQRVCLALHSIITTYSALRPGMSKLFCVAATNPEHIDSSLKTGIKWVKCGVLLLAWKESLQPHGPWRDSLEMPALDPQSDWENHYWKKLQKPQLRVSSRGRVPHLGRTDVQ